MGDGDTNLPRNFTTDFASSGVWSGHNPSSWYMDTLELIVAAAFKLWILGVRNRGLVVTSHQRFPYSIDNTVPIS